jgi:hypothetical protein
LRHGVPVYRHPDRVLVEYVLRSGALGRTRDTRDVSKGRNRFYGVPLKNFVLSPLGTDIDLFHPIDDEQGLREREQLRTSLRVSPDELLCIYTGPFTRERRACAIASGLQTNGRIIMLVSALVTLTSSEPNSGR